MYKETYKGRYRIENIKKYKGDISDVIYRSSWELKFMRWCDSNPSVLEWGSETVIIPYRSPMDNNIHRYFVDFYIKIQDKDKKILKYLIEIKPEKFTKPPPIPQKRLKVSFKKYLIMESISLNGKLQVRFVMIEDGSF